MRFRAKNSQLPFGVQRYKRCFSLLILLLLVSCSADDQLPPQTRVTIAPEEFVWNVYERLDENGNCIVSLDDYQDNYFVVTVADSSGRPIGEADVSIGLSPSNSTSNPAFNDVYVFYLYDDLNGNGVVDHPAELVSGSTDTIVYDTTTEKHHGTKSMIVRSNTSCGGLLATLDAFAGDGFAASSIIIDAVDPEEN